MLLIICIIKRWQVITKKIETPPTRKDSRGSPIKMRVERERGRRQPVIFLHGKQLAKTVNTHSHTKHPSLGLYLP